MATNNWIIDGEETTTASGAAVKWEDDRFFTLEYKGKIFNGEVVENKSEDRQLRIKINHREFSIKKAGQLDALIAELGLDVPKVKKLKELQAPMPGRIVSIAAKVGDNIQPGDPILTLEAMKMENVLKAEGEGLVKSILISVDDVVDKGKVLIDFE